MVLETGVIMRTTLRGSPSWPGRNPETGYVDADCIGPDPRRRALALNPLHRVRTPPDRRRPKRTHRRIQDRRYKFTNRSAGSFRLRNFQQFSDLTGPDRREFLAQRALDFRLNHNLDFAVCICCMSESRVLSFLMERACRKLPVFDINQWFSLEII
jgi:hypothetical protein